METISLRTEIIEVAERHRALDNPACDRLAASMKEIGLRQPISIRVVDMMVIEGKEVEGVPVLVAGRHRLEAAKRLGWSHIDCIEVDDDQLRAELWEIDENLMRAELSPAQQAEHLARRKEVWEALQSSGKTFPTKEGFSSQTAKATGETKRNVNLQIARAEALGPDIKLVAGTSLDKGVELDALAKMTPEQRAPVIERAVAGETVSARHVVVASQDVDEEMFAAFLKVWNRSPEHIRQRIRDFVDEPVFDRTRAAHA